MAPGFRTGRAWADASGPEIAAGNKIRQNVVKHLNVLHFILTKRSIEKILRAQGAAELFGSTRIGKEMAVEPLVQDRAIGHVL